MIDSRGLRESSAPAVRHAGRWAEMLLCTAWLLLPDSLSAREWPRTLLRVEQVARGGRGHQAGVRPGDVLVSYDGQDLATLEDLRRAMSQAIGRGRIELLILPHGRRLAPRVAAGSMGRGRPLLHPHHCPPPPPLAYL